MSFSSFLTFFFADPLLSSFFAAFVALFLALFAYKQNELN